MTVRLHAVGMIVKDMAKTLDFYRALGLDSPAGEDHSPHVEYENTDGYVIGFDTEDAVRQNDSKWNGAGGAQRVNLQFECASPADVDAIYSRLIAIGAGGYMAPWDAFWGQRFGRVTDPDVPIR